MDNVANIFGFKVLGSEPQTIPENYAADLEALELPMPEETAHFSPSTRRLPPRFAKPSLADAGVQQRRASSWKPAWWGPMTSSVLEEHNRSTGSVPLAWTRSAPGSPEFQASQGNKLIQFIARCRAVVRGAEDARAQLSAGSAVGQQDAVQRIMDYVGGTAPSEAGSAATIDPEDVPNGSVVRGRRALHRDGYWSGGRQAHLTSDNLTVSTPRRTPTRISSHKSSHRDGMGNVIVDPDWDVTRTPSRHHNDDWGQAPSWGAINSSSFLGRQWSANELDRMLDPVLPGDVSHGRFG